MTFEPNQMYFRTSGTGSITALVWDSPFTVTFYLRMPHRTSGHLTVSLLEYAPKLPFGITGTTGPWHRSSSTVDLLTYPIPDALALAEVILENQRRFPPIKTLNGGLPWPVDRRDFGV